MSKINRSRLIKFIALILPLLFLFVFGQEFLFYDHTYDTQRLEKFYEEEKNSIDVIFIGASEVTQGYLPGYAYDNYGFTSYLYTVDSNMGSLYLSELKEILKHQNPDYLFVDLSGFLVDKDPVFFNNIVLQNYSRGIPYSKNKLQTLLQYPSDETLSFFFPLIMYHGHPTIAYVRLSEVYDRLTKVAQPSSLKGIVTRSNIYSGTGDPGKEFDPDTYGLTDNVEAYLVEFLEYCKQNGLNVIFTNYPRRIVDESNYYLLFLFNQAESIIERYGYPVWNLQDEMDTIGIDINQDFSDIHHLNIYGQLKMTDYFGNRIMNEFGLTPRIQSERNELEWEACASNTQEFIKIVKESIQSGRDMAINEKSVIWVYRK